MIYLFCLKIQNKTNPWCCIIELDNTVFHCKNVMLISQNTQTDMSSFSHFHTCTFHGFEGLEGGNGFNYTLHCNKMLRLWAVPSPITLMVQSKSLRHQLGLLIIHVSFFPFGVKGGLESLESSKHNYKSASSQPPSGLT